MKGAIGAVLCACVLTPFLIPSNVQSAPLTIGYSDWPGYVAWEVAIQKGFFKDAGVDVQFVWGDYGDTITNFAAGKTDADCIVAGDALVTGAGGKPSVGVVLLDFSNGNDMIIGRPGVDSIKDLKGKTVAVEYGLVEHELLLKALEVNGMTDADITIDKYSTNDAPQTLASGKVAAVGCWYPISGQTLKLVGGSKPLFTSADAPGLIYDELAVSKDSLAAHRDEWEKVVGVWFRTVKYIYDPATHDDAMRIMAGKVSVDPVEYSKSLSGTAILGADDNLKHLEKHAGLDSVYGSMKVSDDFYTKFQVYATHLNTDSYVTPRLVEAVTGQKVK